MKNQIFAIHKNEDGEFELWSDACGNHEAAMSQAELRLLNTFGSRSNKYAHRINRLFTINGKEAHYLGLIKLDEPVSYDTTADATAPIQELA